MNDKEENFKEFLSGFHPRIWSQLPVNSGMAPNQCTAEKQLQHRGEITSCLPAQSSQWFISGTCGGLQSTM
jgi:hypothetical protein